LLPALQKAPTIAEISHEIHSIRASPPLVWIWCFREYAYPLQAHDAPLILPAETAMASPGGPYPL